MNNPSVKNKQKYYKSVFFRTQQKEILAVWNENLEHPVNLKSSELLKTL